MTAATVRRGFQVARREMVAIVTGRYPVMPSGSRFRCPGSRLTVDAARLVHPDQRAGCLTCGHHVQVEAGRFIGHDHEGRRLT